MPQRPQILFLRYAFPCAGITLARGVINQSQFDQLEQAVKNNQPVDWDILESIFIPAFRRLAESAKKHSQKTHDPKFIRDYFLKYHNNFIDKNDGSYACAPSSLKKLCRIEKSKVLKVASDHYIVKIDKKKRPISKTICPDAKVGDTVSVHYGYAVEILKL